MLFYATQFFGDSGRLKIFPVSNRFLSLVSIATTPLKRVWNTIILSFISSIVKIINRIMDINKLSTD